MTPNAANEQASGKTGVVSGLVQLSFLVQVILGRVADSHDLTIVQGRLLVVLSDREPTMLMLARIMGLEKSSLTGLVERAERRGLVQRFMTEESRRAVRVRLTEEGRRRAAAYGADARAQMDGLVRGLSVAERQQLAALTSRIVQGYATAHEIDLSTLADVPR